MVDPYSAIMKRSDMEEVPYNDAECSSSHVQLSDVSSGKSKFFPAFIATLVAALGPFNFGFVLGYSSPVEKSIESIESHPHLNADEFSWFASLVGIGAIAGALLGGWAIEYFGRKTSLMIYSVPFSAGWLLISNAKNGWMMFVGRILTGLAVGSTSLTVPVYIAEISHPDYRGGLGSINQLAVTLGILIAYLIGSNLSWQYTSLIAVGPVALLLLLMLFMPETPRWLLANNQRNKALKELRWLRGPTYDIEEECFEIESNLDMQEKMSLTEMWQPALRKPLIIGVMMMVFQQMSGVNAILFYAKNIFDEAKISNSTLASILFGLAQLVSTGVACLVVDRVGRRILLLIGGFGMMICMTCVGLYYELKKSTVIHSHTSSVTLQSVSSISHSVDGQDISWLVIGGALLFICFFSLGWGPLPWLLMSEVFPPRAKGLAGSICTLANWLFVFIVTKTFHSMISQFTEQGTFWFFGAFCLLSFIFVYFFVPETKGRSLEDIEHYFSEGHFPNQIIDQTLLRR